MDCDPIVLRLSSYDLDGDILDPGGRKPLCMIIIVFDSNSEQGMLSLDFSNRVSQHFFGDISNDSRHHGYD